jgi:hypothetical protein
VLAVRVPNVVAEALEIKAGGPEALPEFLRRALYAAASSKLNVTRSGAQLEGYDEGKRQGWAHANRVFREALQKAAAELKR